MCEKETENNDMLLIHGSYKEHYNTAMRTKRNGVTRIWSGDLRNPYLAENIIFIEHEGLADISVSDSESDYINQASFFELEWN